MKHILDTHDTAESVVFHETSSSVVGNLEELGFGKHALTPESKSSNESKSKRFAG